MKKRAPFVFDVCRSIIVFTGCIVASTCYAQSTQINAPVWSTYAIADRGPDSRVWQRYLIDTDPDGETTTNYQSYVELATGICYLDNGHYVDTVEQVTAVAGGAQAIQGQHQVVWANNANTSGGAVTITTPDGKQIASEVFGLAYYDTASGSNAPVAYLQNCEGAISPPNQVIYAGAFTDLKADLCYTYTRAGLSQDVILHQSPPAPHEFGLSDKSTVLQVYSQFFNPPAPEITAVTNANVVDDQVLGFGDMSIGIGDTLFFDAQNTSLDAGPVSKQWVQYSNSVFLIEAIPYGAVSNFLQQVPQASNMRPSRGSVRRTAFLESRPSQSTAAAIAKTPMKVEKVNMGGRRLAVDYNLLNNSGSITLQGDTTYLVTSLVNITGTLTVEGGSVIKYTNTGVGEINVSGSGSNIVCETGPYSPAVFTSMNDNSVGQVILDSSGTPNVTGKYLNFDVPDMQPMTLRYLRMSYAATAISGTITSNSTAANWIKIWDCQFFDSTTANYFVVECSSLAVYVYNDLFSELTCAVDSPSTSTGTMSVSAVNVTADSLAHFASNNITSSGVNSIFTSVTSLGLVNLTNCYTGGSSGVYQTAGAGSYYLASGSNNRDAGTSAIDAGLLADLQTLTTYPPVIISGTSFTNDYTFFPTAQRDTDTLDLGYHYCPLDYALNIYVQNATLNVLPGTALGMFGSQYGMWLNDDAVIQCNGTANSPIYIVRYNTVQEQSDTTWETTNWTGDIIAETTSTGDSGNFFFTDWLVLASDTQLYSKLVAVPFGFMSCQFYNGEIYEQTGTFSSTNSLYRRVYFQLQDPGGTPSDSFFNNLFWQGSLTYKHNQTGTWTFRDNLFDQVNITNLVTNTVNICDNNAYATNVTTLSLSPLFPTNGAIFLTNSPMYQAGPLGGYYYPSNYVLYQHGSWSATNVGLYHYTVITNNSSVEGNNTVSIGFHYVGCSNGVPIDTNGDGIPDYLEDANGNAVVDSGEIGWNLTNDLGLTVIITQPVNNSQIP